MSSVASRSILARIGGFRKEMKETMNLVFDQHEERGRLNRAYIIIAGYVAIYFGWTWNSRRSARKLADAKKAAKPDIVADALARSGIL